AIPRGTSIRVLDVGVGASCIYPLLGHAEYGWRFVGSEIDATSLQVAAAIVHANGLDKVIALRHQPRPGKVFAGVVREDERFDLTLCNPPFHASAREAGDANQRKLRQLGAAPASSRHASPGPAPNFGGQWRTGIPAADGPRKRRSPGSGALVQQPRRPILAPACPAQATAPGGGHRDP